jgi:cell wall-associated NlpC family hydrolase
LAKKPSGRRRADVEVNILEQFELRSRRSLKDAERSKSIRAIRRAERKVARAAEKEMAKAQNQVTTEVNELGETIVRQVVETKTQRQRSLKSFLTMTISLGMLTTAALPAYAFSPDVAAMSRFTTTDASAIANNADTQNLTVVAVNLNVYKRSIYKSVSAEEIMRKQLLTSIRIDNSPKVAALLANPPFSKLDPVQIMNVAAKYEGVPYAFGGDTPAAFDCSGYVAYVFANFGVPLPHSVHGQDLVGKRIKDEHARPGDLVVFDDLSHDGIYAGNGNFWHAPRRGDRVKLAPIYSANIHFVRIVKPE